MKKIYTTIFGVLFLGGVTIAQPTITSSNFLPAVGETIQYFVADSFATVDPTVGANVTFDYSALKGYGTTGTQYYINPSSTAHASSFAGANLADSITGQGGNVSYWSSDVNGMYSEGYVLAVGPPVGDALITYDTDNEKVMGFPFNYNDVINDNFSGNLTAFGMPNTLTGSVVVQADAWGTLLLPNAVSVSNVMRIKISETATSNTTLGQVNITTTSHSYYDPANTKFPVLSFRDYNVTGAVTVDFTVVLSQYALNPGASINEIDTKYNVNLYPNPTTNNSTISFDLTSGAYAKVELLNMVGQQVENVFEGDLNAGTPKFDISTLDLSNGIYFVKLTIDGQATSKKLIVNK